MFRNLVFLISLSSTGGLGVCGLVFAAPAKHVEIAYELTRNGAAVAESVEKLEHDGKAYSISGQTKGKGLLALRGDVTRVSRGMIGPEGLRPAEFEDLRSGRETARAKFDWRARTLTLQTGEGTAESRPLPEDAHDRLSFAYSFAFRTPGSAPIGFSVTDGKGLSVSVYQPAGRETLKTPAGEFETLKMARRKNSPEDRVSEIWLSVRHGLVPVRVLVVEKDGTRIDQVATRLVTR